MNLDPAIFDMRNERRCRVSDCGRRHFGHGLCRTHWLRKRRGMDLAPPIRTWTRRDGPRPPCSVVRCSRPVKTRGLCAGHYRRKVVLELEDWDRPLKLYRRKGQTKDVNARLSKVAYGILKRQATDLGRDLAEHLRIILEEHAARLGFREVAC